MNALLGVLLSITSFFISQGNHDTEHYLINNSEGMFAITVELKDNVNDPTFGTTMYSIAPGEAVIISVVKGKAEFVHPTSYFKYKFLSDAHGNDLNIAENWVFEKISDTKARYQITLN
ncbi:MAG: hypothetical protein H6582_07955 [Crocinitomicaceae bacterium]|nr:hypothetical protein [Crocinitomicaceae bacterium]